MPGPLTPVKRVQLLMRKYRELSLPSEFYRDLELLVLAVEASERERWRAALEDLGVEIPLPGGEPPSAPDGDHPEE